MKTTPTALPHPARSLRRRTAALAAALVGGAALAGACAPSALADSCRAMPEDYGDGYEHCDGLHHDFLGSKLTGESDFDDHPTQVGQKYIEFYGTLTDNQPGDGLCTSARVLLNNAYYTNAPREFGRNCSATAKTVRFDAWGDEVTYPGTVQMQHCQEFKDKPTVCTTFFTRRFTR